MQPGAVYPDETTMSRSRYWPFFLWLVAFYAAWLALLWTGDLFGTALAHWPMAVAMAAGSYVAGSTPMGGGTVGFPVLVLLMNLPATLGRDFSFAIQAVGMTSASIYILCSRRELEWPMLKAALPGALIGTPLGILFVAPLASDLFIKLLFASMWCSFGLLHLRLIQPAQQCGLFHPQPRDQPLPHNQLLLQPIHRHDELPFNHATNRTNQV